MNTYFDEVMDDWAFVHIWLGNITQEEETYEAYFEGDFKDGEEVLSDFARDLGLTYDYDPDYIAILPLFDQALSARELLENEATIAKEDFPKALARCEALGITEANAMVVWNNAMEVADPEKSYNGLTYIGRFRQL